jgi:leader peptidase (prepilin peptidase) / N-methyltransferase
VEREPVVAITSALVALGLYTGFGADWLLLPYLGFLTLTMALLVTDLEQFRIVDRLNLRGTLILALSLAGAALATGGGPALVRGLLGAAAYFGGASVMWLAVRGKGFGAGDVKLAPLLGLFTAFISWGTLGWAVFAMALIGGVVGVAMLAAGAARMKTELPYGPPMIMGAWLAVILAAIGSIPIGS